MPFINLFILGSALIGILLSITCWFSLRWHTNPEVGKYIDDALKKRLPPDMFLTTRGRFIRKIGQYSLVFSGVFIAILVLKK